MEFSAVHIAAVALGYFAYNFIKINRTLPTTPAMAAGITNHLWEVNDLVSAQEAEERCEVADGTRDEHAL